MTRFLLQLTTAIGLAAPVWAGDVALLISNRNYDAGVGLEAASDVASARAALQRAGFEVFSGRDLDGAGLRALVRRADAAADGEGRLVIAVTGQMVQAAGATWLLGVDAQAPDAYGAPAGGVALERLLDVAARAPGRAVVVFGEDASDFQTGTGVLPGIGEFDIPQGVSVLRGPSAAAVALLSGALLEEGASVASAAARQPSLQLEGFVAPAVPFQGAVAETRPDPNAEERGFWRAAEALDSKEGYDAYLKVFPGGQFAEAARAALAELEAAPLRNAERAEDGLGLSRDARRQIQRDLTLLDFDPKGIDGIFGRGSRAAIARFQRVNGLEETGFVSAPMIAQLRLQAERRSAELEAEAERRKAAFEREDRAYWEATGKLGDEPGLRAYLERYPDGLFAEIATVRLAPFEQARREAAAAQDRADWDAAGSVDTLAAYRGYLQGNPDGAFKAEAEARIAELEFQERNAEALQAAARNEARLGMNEQTRRLVEDRLMRLGLKPGEVDGQFDDRTRRAIRRYQDARNLQKTGYLNQATVVRLLADSVLRP